MKRLDAVAVAEAKDKPASSSGKSNGKSSPAPTSLRQRGGGETAVDDDNEQHREDPAPMHRGKVVSYRGQTCNEIPYLTWGQPTRYLAARYHTGRGNEIRHSYLLLSGFWGMSRHMNYLGQCTLSPKLLPLSLAARCTRAHNAFSPCARICLPLLLCLLCLCVCVFFSSCR